MRNRLSARLGLRERLGTTESSERRVAIPFAFGHWFPSPRRTIILATAGGRMSQVRSDSRRSTRVPLKVVLSARGLSEQLTCDGETIVVNRHGALISSTVPLRMGLKIEIHVVITDKSAKAEVVYLDAERPFICGVALEKPENIWGLSLPPDDWYESRHEP